MQEDGQGGSEPELGYRCPRFCHLSGSPRDVGTGPPGQASPRRKGWNPSRKALKSRQIKGGPHGVRRAVPRTVHRRHAKVGGTLPGANGVNRSTHSAGCGGKGGTLDGGTSTGVIRRKATGVAGRSASPCSVGIGYRRDVGFCNIPRNLPTGPVNVLPCLRPMGSVDQIVMCGLDVVHAQGIWNRNQRRWYREAGKLRQSDHGAGKGRPQSQSRWCRQRVSGLRQVPSLLRPRMRGVIVSGQTPLGCGLDFQRMGWRPMGRGDTIVTNAIGVVQPMAAKNPDRRNRRRGSGWHGRSGRVVARELLPSSRVFGCPVATSPHACAASYSSASRRPI